MMKTAPALIADIGGTHARFAIIEDGQVTRINVLATQDFPSLAAAAKSYMARHDITVTRAALSLAATIVPGSDEITLTNLATWNTTRSDLRRELSLNTLELVNDFAALAYGVVALGETAGVKINGGKSTPHAPLAIIGPGTGLGMAGVVFIDGRPHILDSEGGNATLPATTPREYAVIEKIRQIKGGGHVSAEDAVSGNGLPFLYQAIAQLGGHTAPLADAAAIADAAINGQCDIAKEAFDLFCRWLGVMAGNLALTLNAFGGVYIAGGIIPQWLDDFRKSPFLDGFADKGPYSDTVAKIPVYVVTDPYPALAGMHALLVRNPAAGTFS